MKNIPMGDLSVELYEVRNTLFITQLSHWVPRHKCEWYICKYHSV